MGEGWTEMHTATGDTLTPSTGAQGAAHAAGGGAGLLYRPHALTAPPDAPQATTGGDGRSYPPTAPRRDTAAQSEPQRVRCTPIRIWKHSTAKNPETRTAQGLTGYAEKKFGEFEKRC